jgi:glycosyltransferase involved in cell wall biosynthesis
MMAQRLIDKGVRPERIEIISNWATGDEAIVRDARNELRAAWGLQGRFVILYSGNIGIAHDVATPIAALRILLQSKPDARLIFVGKGSRLGDAERAVAEAAHAVQFRSLVPAALLPHSLGLADVALVTLREGFQGLVVPSKLIGYMARAVPTLYVGPYGDVEQLLIESGGGESVRNGDAEGMARVIQRLMEQPAQLARMGAAAEHYYQSSLSRSKGLEKYQRLVESVLIRSATPGTRSDTDTGNRS